MVREALGRLQIEGLIRTRRGSGSFALTPPPAPAGTGFPPPARSLADRRALLELRAGCESEAAALAAARRTDAHLVAMRDALEAFSRADADPSAAVDLDFTFHRTIAEASANSYLLGLIDALGPSMIAMPRYRLEPSDDAPRRVRPEATNPSSPEVTNPSGAEAANTSRPEASRPSRLHDVTAEHASVLAAITASDALAASAAMRSHLAGSRFRAQD